MNVPIFYFAIFATAIDICLTDDEIGVIRPASQIMNNQFKKHNKPQTPKEVAGCGIPAVSREDSKIYGGADSTLNEFPWQALVLIRNANGILTGGGSLLNEEWVLTAGHLTDGGTSGYAELGSYHISTNDPGQMKIDIIEIVTHPQYQGVDHNDIGLVRLVSAALYSDSIRPICLPSYGDFVGGGMTLTISGWGTTSTGNPDILQKASVVSMTTADCAATGLINIDDTKICTTSVSGTGTCFGDSGGPLSLVSGGKTYSVGITSFVINGCGSTYPDGFTRTTAYLTWISSTTGITIDP